MSSKFDWKNDKEYNVSQCAMCKYKMSGSTCTAFPYGIPKAILTNKHNHKEKYPGDHGIRYESVDN